MQETGFNERERIARQLESIEGRYEELSIRITLPEVISDTPLLTRLMREHSELSELNDIAVRFKKLSSDLEDAKEMLSDPDMAELARAEIDELSFAVCALELSMGFWDDLLFGRARVRRFTLNRESGDVLVDVAETEREGEIDEERNDEGPDHRSADRRNGGDGLRNHELAVGEEDEPAG